jgi:hypothetical protein
MNLSISLADGRFEVEGFVSKADRRSYPEVSDLRIFVEMSDIMFGYDRIDLTEKLTHQAQKHYEEMLIEKFRNITMDDPDGKPYAADPDDDWTFHSEGGL